MTEVASVGVEQRGSVPPVAQPQEQPADRDMRERADLAALFSALWAVAALFHILSGPMRYQAFPEADALGVTSFALGLVAVAVLLRPRAVRLLLGLASLQLLSVWLEAPVLGSHWLTAGAVALTILLAAASLAYRHRTIDVGGLFAAFAPAARWVLLVSYAFAAFAKLNHAFLDPAVSCAVFFFRETTGAVGLTSLAETSSPWLLRGLIVGTVAIELAIPVLLVLRRTRPWGVLLAVTFHAVLALDLAHPFFDYSSLLFALFVLFLPAPFASWLKGRSGVAPDGSPPPRRVRRVLGHAGIAVLFVLVLAAMGPPSQTLAVLVFANAYLAWFGYAALSIAVVTIYVASRRPRGGRGFLGLRSTPLIALVVPLLVLNGLAPYLELKTAYSFNMYSNLVTVAGESNHLVVTRTLPLGDAHDDLVTVRSSSAEDLEWYADNDYALTWRSLRTYLGHHPDVTVEYLRDGEPRRHAGGPASESVPPVPTWQEKLLVFRAVDLHDPPRCQDRWGPAN